jgi:hypothetical protein
VAFISDRPLLAVFAACALPRLAALAVWPIDTDTLYYALSTGLLRDGQLAIDGGVTTRIEPFYPFVLAVGRLITGDRLVALLVLQVLAASLGGVLFFSFARAALGDERAAWIAALLHAASPYLIRQSVAFMEVTPAIVLLIAAAWCLARLPPVSSRPAWLPPSGGTSPRVPPSGGSSLLLGLLLAATVLTRFSFLPIAIGALVIVWMRAGAARALASAAAMLACLVPWMLYSHAVSGTALPPRVGENLFMSTSEYARPIVPAMNVDLLVPLVGELVVEEMTRRGRPDYGLDEQDRLLMQWTIDFVRAHPVEAAGMKLKNLAFVFQPRLLPFYDMVGRATLVDGRLAIPEQARRPLAYELAAGTFQAVLLAGGIAGFVIRRRMWRDDAFLLVVAVGVIGVNAIFFPTSRLLAPMTFVWMFYVAAAVRWARTDGR